MAVRIGAETTPQWIASIPAARRRPEAAYNCVNARHIPRVAVFIHGDRNGWR